MQAFPRRSSWLSSCFFRTADAMRIFWSPCPDVRGWGGGLRRAWCWACAASAEPWCFRAQSMAAWADGCSQCSVHSACSSSFPLLFLSEGFTNELTRLHSSLPSPWFAVFSVLLRFSTFSLAFSSLFPVPPVLTVPCYFPLNSALIGWLFVCTNPLSVCITTVISLLPHSHPSCVYLCPSHMFCNLSLRSAGIIDCHGDGLQERQPFSVLLTGVNKERTLNDVITKISYNKWTWGDWRSLWAFI